MIFAEITDKEIHRLLKESGSNWLIKESQTPGILAIYYIAPSRFLDIFHIIFAKKGWEVYSRKQYDQIDDQIAIQSTANDNLTQLIKPIADFFIDLYQKKELNWYYKNSIVFIPERAEETTNPLYNNYSVESLFQKQISSENSFDKMDYNPENWPHQIALEICLLDKLIYPRLAVKGDLKLAFCNKAMLEVHKQPNILFQPKQTKVEDQLYQHYLNNIKAAHKYRVKRTCDEISSFNIQKNKRLAASFTAIKTQKDIKHEVKVHKEPQQVHVSSIANYASTANMIGTKSQQEDRAFILADELEIHQSWQERIPELLMYVTQKLNAKIYHDLSSESHEQFIGTTLSLCFVINSQAYIAWLGDSPVISVNISEGSQARHLIWPHVANEDFCYEQEKERIKAEGGSIIIKNKCARLNGTMMVVRAIGDKAVICGDGMSDIPSFCCESFSEQQKQILILGSDGLTDSLSLPEITTICQTTPFAELAKVLCKTAYENSNESTDNISATTLLLQDEQKPILAVIFDGHGNKIGDCLADFANEQLPKLFRSVAAAPAPSEIVINAVKSNLKRQNTLCGTESLNDFFKKPKTSNTFDSEKPSSDMSASAGLTSQQQKNSIT